MDDDDDGWVSMAMSNELVVANLLLQLRRETLPSPPPPPRRCTKRASPVLNVQWRVHRPRSTKKRSNSTKGEPVSPNTPLSWNASTSTGGAVAAASAADGRDVSSGSTNRVGSSRSKIGDQKKTATAKNSTRKRTLAELKEEESLLLKQRTDLKNELASLHHTVEKHRATNQSLKRIKLNLASRHILTICTTSMVSGETVLGPPQLAAAHCHPSGSVSPQTVKDNNVLAGAPNGSSKQEEISYQEPLFLLPDLNLPAGEDFSSQV